MLALSEFVSAQEIRHGLRQGMVPHRRGPASSVTTFILWTIESEGGDLQKVSNPILTQS